MLRRVLTSRRAALRISGLAFLGAALASTKALAAAFDVGDTGWEGYSELYEIAKKELGPDRVKPVGALDWSKLKADDGVLFIHPLQPIDTAEASQFMKIGGRVAVLDDFGRGDELLRRFRIERVPMPGRPVAALRNNPDLPVAEPWIDVSNGKIGAPHPVAANSKRIVLNHPMALLHPDLSPVLKVRCGGSEDAIVAVAGQVDKGRLFAMSDPSALINSMLRYPGNRAFGAALVRYLASDNDRAHGRLYIATNHFTMEGSVGGERTLLRDIEAQVSDLADSLARARALGLPPWMLAVLAAVSVAAAGVWVGRASAKPYRSPVPRYARATPLVARGGVAGRFAMLAAPSSPRSLLLLELKSALFEAATDRLGLDPSPSSDAVLRAIAATGKVDEGMMARLRESLRRMQRAESAVLSGSGLRVDKATVEEAHAVVTEVVARIGALEARVRATAGPQSARSSYTLGRGPDDGASAGEAP
jgi:hypothetical protein